MRLVARFLAMLAMLLAIGATGARAQGTAAEARAMLDHAAAALRANEAKAIAAFNSPTGGFRQGDLYVFCATRSGRVVAHVDPAQIGRHIQDVYDIDGVALGKEIMDVAREGEVSAVSYMWPKPGTHEPAQKVTFVTRVGDHVCGVGYYK